MKKILIGVLLGLAMLGCGESKDKKIEATKIESEKLLQYKIIEESKQPATKYQTEVLLTLGEKDKITEEALEKIFKKIKNEKPGSTNYFTRFFIDISPDLITEFENGKIPVAMVSQLGEEKISFQQWDNLKHQSIQIYPARRGELGFVSADSLFMFKKGLEKEIIKKRYGTPYKESENSMEFIILNERYQILGTLYLEFENEILNKAVASPDNLVLTDLQKKLSDSINEAGQNELLARIIEGGEKGNLKELKNTFHDYPKINMTEKQFVSMIEKQFKDEDLVLVSKENGMIIFSYGHDENVGIAAEIKDGKVQKIMTIIFTEKISSTRAMEFMGLSGKIMSILEPKSNSTDRKKLADRLGLLSTEQFTESGYIKSIYWHNYDYTLQNISGENMVVFSISNRYKDDEMPEETVYELEKPDIKTEEKQTEKINTPVKSTSTPKPKKLIYSEDDVYTHLLWKGYREAESLKKFKADHGLPVNDVIDEKVLRALGMEVKYK